MLSQVRNAIHTKSKKQFQATNPRYPTCQIGSAEFQTNDLTKPRPVGEVGRFWTRCLWLIPPPRKLPLKWIWRGLDRSWCNIWNITVALCPSTYSRYGCPFIQYILHCLICGVRKQNTEMKNNDCLKIDMT